MINILTMSPKYEIHITGKPTHIGHMKFHTTKSTRVFHHKKHRI